MSRLEKELGNILAKKRVKFEKRNPTDDPYLRAMNWLFDNIKPNKPEEKEKIKIVGRFLATYPDYPMKDVPFRVLDAISFTLTEALKINNVRNEIDQETTMAILTLGYTLGRCKADERLREYE